jgi:hypothetical protein
MAEYFPEHHMEGYVNTDLDFSRQPIIIPALLEPSPRLGANQKNSRMSNKPGFFK